MDISIMDIFFYYAESKDPPLKQKIFVGRHRGCDRADHSVTQNCIAVIIIHI